MWGHAGDMWGEREVLDLPKQEVALAYQCGICFLEGGWLEKLIVAVAKYKYLLLVVKT